jgi:hypothetical protein
MRELEVGMTYAALKQGVAITPQTINVTVVWLEDGHVHYRREDETLVRQTTTARFREIIGIPPSQPEADV